VSDSQPLGDAGVRLDRDGPVATVTLCRPRVLNAQTPAMWEELRQIGRDLPGDVRVVVVRGEGRAFSAGLDLSAVSSVSSTVDTAVATGSDSIEESGAVDGPVTSAPSTRSDSVPAGAETAGIERRPTSFADLARSDDETAQASIARFQEGFSWLRRPDLVSIAAVRGHAIGAGFQLALACDLRVLAEDAQFTMAEVALGLVPDLGGTKRLVELVGYSRALEICITGRRVGAHEADRLGLATSVVPGGDLDQTVTDLVGQILSANRDAVVEIKALLAAAASHSFARQEEAERAAQLRRIRDVVGLTE
jgi:enoyl-CoA hydratase/carnithine racemase